MAGPIVVSTRAVVKTIDPDMVLPQIQPQIYKLTRIIIGDMFRRSPVILGSSILPNSTCTASRVKPKLPMTMMRTIFRFRNWKISSGLCFLVPGRSEMSALAMAIADSRA